MRDGLTSVARMLPDTSITSITVATRDGRLTSADGRAIANSNSVNAASIRAGGTCRRQVGIAERALAAPEQQQNVASDDQRHQQQQPQQDRRVEGDGGNEASQARPRDLLERLHAGLRMLCLRISAKRITASTTSSSVASSSTSTPERSNALRKAVSRASAAAAKRARKLL